MKMGRPHLEDQPLSMPACASAAAAISLSLCVSEYRLVMTAAANSLAIRIQRSALERNLRNAPSKTASRASAAAPTDHPRSFSSFTPPSLSPLSSASGTHLSLSPSVSRSSPFCVHSFLLLITSPSFAIPTTFRLSFSLFVLFAPAMDAEVTLRSIGAIVRRLWIALSRSSRDLP